jgi:hypothetical protein
MKTKPSLTIVALLWLGSTLAAFAQNKSDEVKQRVLAQAKSISPDDYAFTRTVRTAQTSGGKTEESVTVEKFDPSKPAEGRWILVSVNAAAPSADDLNSYRKAIAKRRTPGYYRLAGYFGTPATASTDSRGRLVFHFTALPKDTLTIMDTDVSQNGVIDAAVKETNGTPFVEEVRTTVKPMRIKLIAKIETYESTSRFRMGPEGKPLLAEQTSDMSGSMMIVQGGLRLVTTYSDYRPAGKKP